MPTYKQLFTVAQVCQSFSAMLLPIQLFFYDEQLEMFYVIAGFDGTITVTIDSYSRMRLENGTN